MRKGKIWDHLKRFVQITDPLEESFRLWLVEKGIAYEYHAPLDFYLPAFDLHVEIKAGYTDRLARQLKSVNGGDVMVLQGFESIEKFKRLIMWGS